MHELARSGWRYLAEKLSLNENKAKQWFSAENIDILRTT
jgi:hypothetical protein